MVRLVHGMYVFKGSSRHGNRVTRYRYTMRLEQSLVALFNIYDETGGPVAEAAGLIDRRLEECLGQPGASREMAQNLLHTLLRAKDLHLFLLKDEDLVPVKYRIFEHILYHRTAESRWAAIRELLESHLDMICETPLPGAACNAEWYKEQISSRESRLGGLLATAALFNFDLSEEEPPPNLAIRFTKRKFPGHTWEIRQGAVGAAPALVELAHWSPRHPLCRWEYLGADLAHAIFRRRPAGAGHGRRATPALELDDGAPPLGYGGDDGPAVLYCRFAREGLEARQMELLPVKPEAILPELQRHVHRRHGEGGIRILAALLGRFAESEPGRAVTFAVSEVVVAAFGSAGAPQTLRSRRKKVWDVLARMEEMECQRVVTREAVCTLHTSRLATVLDRAEDWRRPAGSGETGEAFPIPRPGQGEPSAQRVRILLDPIFHNAPGTTIAAPYRAIPADILPEAGKGHPYLLALFLYLRGAWANDGESRQGLVDLSARALFREAGLWLNEARPYRPLEMLKRELSHLRELGYVGSWRMIRGGAGHPLEDRYQIEAPVNPAARAIRPAHTEPADTAEAGLPRHANREKGGWA